MPTHNNAEKDLSAYAAWIGLDGADKKHLDHAHGRGPSQRGELAHTPETVEIRADELAQRFPGRSIAWLWNRRGAHGHGPIDNRPQVKTCPTMRQLKIVAAREETNGQ